jgi:uncharacterized protein (UPF0303 family)
MTPDLTADRAHIALQEQQLVFPRFDHDSAWSLGGRLRTLAVSRGHAVAIDIRRFGDPDQQLFFTTLPGTNPDNARWVLRKSRVVARFHRSSYSLGLALTQQQVAFADKYSLPDADYATHGGSFPITVAGAGIIGAVTVSGLPQRSDHELVVEALCLELSLDYAALRLPG